MLEIMQEHGKPHAQQLAENMKAFVTIENTKVAVTLVEGKYTCT